MKFLWRTLAIIVAISAHLFILSCSGKGDKQALNDPEAIAQFTNNLIEERKKKDEFLRSDAQSPLENKASFGGLAYFPADPAYQVEGRFEPVADKTQRIVIPLSDGSEEVYEKYGHAVFKLNGEVCRLLVVKHDDVYSILFKDATSGKTTYGGGRYIDLKESAFNGNKIVIDFNTAYHPYCVYNHNYACPLPPAENTLPVAVEAGEKLKPE